MRLVLGAKARELYGSLDAVFDSRAPPAGKTGAAALQTSFIEVLSTLFRGSGTGSGAGTRQ